MSRCLASLGVLCFTMSALSTAAVGQSPDTINLTALLSMTGPLASIDVPTGNGLKLAVQKINEAGVTVGGKKYTVVVNIEDIQGRPDQAVGIARKIMADKSVNAILGPVGS